MKNFKIKCLTAVMLTVALSPLAIAKEYFAAFKDDVSADYFSDSVKVKSILPNLKVAILEVESESELDYLKLDPNILFVEPEKIIPAPKRIMSKPMPMLQKKQLKIFNPTLPIGVKIVKADQVWSQFTRGNSVRVVVLDSGIDQAHPDLTGRIEKTRGFITTGDSKDENGHGTHVAGTIAANGAGLLGVAPDVKILAGKVCNTGCPTAATLAGVEWAITEKADVVNMSLGGPFGNPLARHIYQKAEDANVIVIAASGNDGAFQSSYPASYPSVFSVGAVDEDLNITSFSNWSKELDVVAPGQDVFSSLPRGSGREGKAAILGSNPQILKVNPMSGSGVGSIKDKEIVFAELGKPADFAGINLSGKIALIKRGEITFKEKYDNAVNAGADGVIVFNNEPGPLNGTMGEEVDVSKVVVGMEMTTGETLANESRNGVVKANLEVLATAYGRTSGTSMATPHVTGVAALIKAANPALTAKEVKKILRDSSYLPLGATEPEKYANGVVDSLAAVIEAKLKSFGWF